MTAKSQKKQVKKQAKKITKKTSKKKSKTKVTAQTQLPAPDTTDESAVGSKLPKKVARHSTAEDMAKQQREISVAEFFTKNRHLLGFDNARRALLTTIKEGVDNALDACEEAGICRR